MSSPAIRIVRPVSTTSARSLWVLILGTNGFIGSSPTRVILKQKDREVYTDHAKQETTGIVPPGKYSGIYDQNIQRRVPSFANAAKQFEGRPNGDLKQVIKLTLDYLGVHFPSDVVAGWVAGTAWTLFCIAAQALIERRAPPLQAP